ASGNTVTFNNGAAGTVTAATATTLTVTFTTRPRTAGPLTAVVTSNGVRAAAAQVAAVTPVVTASTASRAISATQITIAGFGFDPVAANNRVAFNLGAAGTVTAATATSLTVTYSTRPTAVGSLTAVVTTNNLGSGAAVQVATVTPVVTPSTAPRA